MLNCLALSRLPAQRGIPAPSPGLGRVWRWRVLRGSQGQDLEVPLGVSTCVFTVLRGGAGSPKGVSEALKFRLGQQGNASGPGGGTGNDTSKLG